MATARRGLGTIATATTAVLIATAWGYGFHRDELYFMRAGAEPAWGYADNPPLTPLLAHALDVLFDGSILAVRIPSALMAGLVVLITGLMAREFGASRGAQLFAAGCMAVAALLPRVFHWLSTTSLDLLLWTALCWLLVRALRDGGPKAWLLVGLVGGVGMQNKWQPAFLLAAVLIGVLVGGPRAALRSPWPWLGGLLAFSIWAPNLVWQWQHGFPQLELSAAIAGGSSGTSEPWYVFVPFQLLLISPLLVPVWVIGGWRLLRAPELCAWRAFPIAYLLLLAVFTVTGGKPYYLGGLYPVLLAAGAAPVLAWAATRRWMLGVALGLSLAVSAVLGLPLVPPRQLPATPVLAINYDAGEQIGWPEFAATVQAVRDTLPPGERVAVLTQNYGQAGAVDHYRPALGPAYSGHNAYGDRGPPPDDVPVLIVVGFREEFLRSQFGDVRRAATIDNGLGVPNDEQGRPVWVVRDRLASWDTLWARLRYLG